MVAMTIDVQQKLRDPEFRKLLARRSRLRWGLSGLLFGAYLLYAMAGLYATDALATPFFDTGVTWGIVSGYGIILLAIGCSLYYVRAVNRLIAPLQRSLADGDR